MPVQMWEKRIENAIVSERDYEERKKLNPYFFLLAMSQIQFHIRVNIEIHIQICN